MSHLTNSTYIINRSKLEIKEKLTDLYPSGLLHKKGGFNV